MSVDSAKKIENILDNLVASMNGVESQANKAGKIVVEHQASMEEISQKLQMLNDISTKMKSEIANLQNIAY
jgi:uncharacterized protein YukE